MSNPWVQIPKQTLRGLVNALESLIDDMEETVEVIDALMDLDDE